MPALNFQKQFAADVEAGKKTQTIRAKRKAPIRRGQILYLYTGLRTKYARKLKEATCLSVQRVAIFPHGIVLCDQSGIPSLIDSDSALKKFAQDDGFKDWPEMRDWFANTHKGLPFEGQLITWGTLF